MTQTRVGILAVLVAATLTVWTSQAMAQTAIAEDAWFQSSERTYTAYSELAMRASFTETSETPAGELFPGYGEFGFTFGAWVLPVIAVEGQVHTGSSEGGGFLDYSKVQRDSIGMRAGLRFALPTYITPMFAAHVDYTGLSNRWFKSEDGTLFGTEGDNPELGVSGIDRHTMLGLNTELGLKFNLGRFTSALVYHALFNLHHTSSRSDVSDNRSVQPDTQDLIGDSPLPKLGFLQNNSEGVELRVGLRF